MHTKFWLGNLTGRNCWKDLGVDGKNNIRMDLREVVWEGMDWLRIATSGELL
jgi:hypothetical protein